MKAKITSRQQSLFEEACKHLVGGVNSPVRAFKAVGGEPFFVRRANGSKLWDTKGREYIDYVMSWGPHILGHAHPDLVSALREALDRGTSFGMPTEEEIELAKLVKEAFPSIDKVRFVSSGTEAVMSAVRLARGFTGRNKIVKFTGCYHGHSDSLLVKAGSGGATFGIPDSSGVPEELAKLTISIPYNRLEALEKWFEAEGGKVACVLVEPVAGNMGLIVPELTFLKKLRELTHRYKVLLIFDEVITGFRIAFGGAQERFGIKADLTCLGKILGGGLPIGGFGGKGEIMERLAPEGDVYQAGTLSGNPLATICGIAMLRKLRDRKIYQELDQKGEWFIRPLESLIAEEEYPVRLNSMASLFTLFFTRQKVTDFASAKTADTSKYARFFRELLQSGVFFPPSQFETCFLSQAHSKEDLGFTLEVIRKSLGKIFK